MHHFVELAQVMLYNVIVEVGKYRFPHAVKTNRFGYIFPFFLLARSMVPWIEF